MSSGTYNICENHNNIVGVFIYLYYLATSLKQMHTNQYTYGSYSYQSSYRYNDIQDYHYAYLQID